MVRGEVVGALTLKLVGQSYGLRKRSIAQGQRQKRYEQNQRRTIATYE
jgi:hypothetical protein